jgi:hypothetical protein
MRLTRRHVVGMPFLTGMGLAASPARAARPRMFVELFTSQGCSSCPPADKLFSEFAREPDMVTVSLAVDYWDYLGWKDTLASPRHTARQKAYAVQRGDRQVYTPQAVVNGLAHALGSSRQAIEAAAKRTLSAPGVLALDIGIEASSSEIAISLPDAVGAAPKLAIVTLMKIRKSCDVEIGRGENNGKSITYANVVQGLVPVGRWEGRATVLKLPRESAAGPMIDAFVVVAQAGTETAPGAVIGAARGLLA